MKFREFSYVVHFISMMIHASSGELCFETSTRL
eukprot:UN14833